MSWKPLWSSRSRSAADSAHGSRPYAGPVRGSRMARRWIGAAALAAAAIACTTAPPPPAPTHQPSPRATTAPAPSSTLTATSSPAPSPELVALVPVVGFWSTRSTIARTELDAARAGRSRSYVRVLVAGTLPGATAASPDAIRAAVNADPRTLGLLPPGEITPDVRALAMDGVDLFGNDRLRDVAAWPLLVPAAPRAAPPPLAPAPPRAPAAGGGGGRARPT